MNDIQRTVAELLKARGLSLFDVSAGTGLSVVSIQDQINGILYFHRRARKIENFLGTAIWTPVQRFEGLNRASAILGADAVIAGFQELRRLAIKLKVPSARKLTSKDDLVDAVLAHVARQSPPATPDFP